MGDIEKEVDSLDREIGIARAVVKLWEGAKEEITNCVRESRKLRAFSIVSIVLVSFSILLNIIGFVFIKDLMQDNDKLKIQVLEINRVLREGIVVEEQEREVIIQDNEDGSGNNVYQSGDGNISLGGE